MRDENRKVEAMADVVKGMTDAEIRFYGAYFAALPPPPGASGPEASRKAVELIKPRRCTNCHAETMAGQGEIARLAGQRADYLAKALFDYRSNRRRGRGNAAMVEIGYTLVDDEIMALAHYLARLP